MKLGSLYVGGRVVAVAAVIIGAGVVATAHLAQSEVEVPNSITSYQQLSKQEQQALTAHIIDNTSPEVLWDLLDEEDRLYLLRTGPQDLPKAQQESILNSMFSQTLKNRTQTLYDKVTTTGEYVGTRLEHMLEQEQPAQKRNAQRLLDYWRRKE